MYSRIAEATAPTPRHGCSLVVIDMSPPTLLLVGGGNYGLCADFILELVLAKGSKIIWNQVNLIAEDELPNSKKKEHELRNNAKLLPMRRAGALVAAVAKLVYIFGGTLDRDTLTNSMLIYDADTRKIRYHKFNTKVIPPPVLKGAMVYVSPCTIQISPHLYTFGGISIDGLCNDMYSYNIEHSEFTKCIFSHSVPAARDSHTMCVWRGSSNSGRPMLVVFGGFGLHTHTSTTILNDICILDLCTIF